MATIKTTSMCLKKGICPQIMLISKKSLKCVLFCLCAFAMISVVLQELSYFSQNSCGRIYINEGGQSTSPSLLIARSFNETSAFRLASRKSQTYLFSGYLYNSESNRSPSIRIVGVTCKTKANLRCIIRTNASTLLPFVTAGRYDVINRSIKYQCYETFVVCNHCWIQNPLAVTVVDDDVTDDVTKNTLPISVPRSNFAGYKYVIVSCISPMHGHYDDKLRLIEWVELNKVLAIEYFVFYVTSVSNGVMNTLHFYVKQGIAEIVEWPILKYYKKEQLHYMGQQAALNDCLLKMKGVAEYLITIDLDEYMLPQMPSDYYLRDVFFRLPRRSVYMFRNAFFHSNVNSTSSVLTSQRILDREEFIHPKKDRTKLIVRVDDTDVLAIHNVWKLLRGGMVVVPPEIGLLHHYRNTHVPCRQNCVKHDVVLKYRKNLEENVHTTLFQIKF